MADNLQLFIYGAAAVLDLVVLLSMVERQNWPYVSLWMLLLTVGVWLWHSGIFIHALLVNSPSPLATQSIWVSMTAMAAGLLLMPSAMMHGLHRFSRTGVVTPSRPNPWLAAYYLPLLLLFPIGAQLATDPREPFILLLKDYSLFYISLMATTNLIVAVGLLRLRRGIEYPRVLQFFTTLAWTLISITVFNILCLTIGLRLWPGQRLWIQLIVALSPIIPTLIFAYYVLRFQLMPLVLERTLSYGAIVASAMLLHQIITHELSATIQEHYRVNFGLIEGILALALILVYQPLRQRVAEALRYLFGSPIQHRDQYRRLSVQLASRSGRPAKGLLDWFTRAAQRAFRVESMTALLFEPDGKLFHQAGPDNPLPVNRALTLARMLRDEGVQTCTRYDAPRRHVLDALLVANASTLIRLDHPPRFGLLLVGSQRFRQSLGEEELNALILLVDQLAATLQNGQLLADRSIAERRAAQQEKLSALGLIAGSIAHEVKNPLSSIKSIATVLAEDLGQDSPHAEDLRIILGEIDRLSATASQLLDVARSPSNNPGNGDVAQAVRRTVKLLAHYARQQDVNLDVQCDANLPAVQTDESTLQEIFFNLISNSIEAAGRGGKIRIRCHPQGNSLIAEVHDNGPGLPKEVQERLFEPLVTTKATGTGLGLYVVGQRVHDCGGEISCISSPEQGTAFRIQLPVEQKEASPR